jgi:SH3 domain protein
MTLLIAALLASPLAFAQQQGRAQYISDDVSVSIREKPSNDAGSLGTIKSGARVTVLESLGPDSYARIRTADGREGWITARFLSNEPAAKDQLAKTQQQFDEARAQAQNLQRELDTTRQQLAQAKPALELAAQNDQLKATIAEREHAVAELERRFNEEKARRDTLIAGAGLVGGGILIGLILPWLGRNRKRRYSDF